jgi:hypothetical protein
MRTGTIQALGKAIQLSGSLPFELGLQPVLLLLSEKVRVGWSRQPQSSNHYVSLADICIDVIVNIVHQRNKSPLFTQIG